MSKILHVAAFTVSIILFYSKMATAQTTPNLVTNGDLEARNHAPHGPGPSGGQGNIGPIDSNHRYADLQNWHYPPSPSSFSQSPTYRASDGETGVTTTTFAEEFGYYGYGFTAHSGISCVSIMQHDVTGDNGADDFITQQLNQPLLAGHSYHVEFWALRLPGAAFRTKLALSITAGDPTYNAAQNTLSPSPGNKVVVSGDIQQRSVWTRIIGDIVIPNSETTNQWVSVGYDRSGQTYDASAIHDPIGGINFAIDDISLVDMGCAPAPSPVAYQYGQQDDDCYNVAHFHFTNYDATLTYTFNRGNGNPSFIRNAGTSPGDFIVKVSGNQMDAGASFTITATSTCGTSTTSGEIEATYQCVGISAAATKTTAYPNPAAESITAPDGAENAVLVNDQGKTLKTADKSGKVDVQNLPDGLYNLRMLQKGKLINQRIQVKH
jgi:hypothetical protein